MRTAASWVRRTARVKRDQRDRDVQDVKLNQPLLKRPQHRESAADRSEQGRKQPVLIRIARFGREARIGWEQTARLDHADSGSEYRGERSRQRLNKWRARVLHPRRRPVVTAIPRQRR